MEDDRRHITDADVSAHAGDEDEDPEQHMGDLVEPDDEDEDQDQDQEGAEL